ncbi:MAG: LuxR C-terminal-related transcriptional regulator [Dehalococcoidia bacterium]
MDGMDIEAAPAPALLETRFFPPAWRGGLVRRPRLVQRLERGAQGRVTVISARAGAGKTTLLGEWLASKPGRTVAWLSLDRGDGDPGRFLEYVVEALRRAHPHVGGRALAMVRTRQPYPAEVVLTAVLNDAAAEATPVVLVLDDYHAVESEAVHQAMAFLIDHMPRQMHLVLASRADPPIPIARLRSRGDLTELRSADLAFSTDEAAAFLKDTMGLQVSADDIAALERRTEGWIAGLQLAALSMEGRDDHGAFVAAFAGNDRYIVDYLLEEVLHRQPAHVRDFLLKTSILDRLYGPLCDALTGRADGAATLEGLERANLFVVALDDRRQWFRYHHLFSDVLRAHVNNDAKYEVRNLHRAASDWYTRAGQAHEAISQALVGGHVERAAELIESIASDVVRAYQPLQLLEWLRQLPDEVVAQRPVLCAYYAFGLFPAGEMGAALRWLDVASRAADGRASAASPGRPDEALALLQGLTAVARGYHAMATGDVTATVEHSQRALEVLPADQHTWRSGAALLLALAPWRMGDLNAAAAAHSRGVEGLERSGDVALAVSALYDAGKLAMWRGRLTEACRHYERALSLWNTAGNPLMPGAADAHLGLSAVAAERGDLGAAARHQHIAEELAQDALLPETLSRLAAGRARLHELNGDFAAAIEDLCEAERSVVPATVPSVPMHARRARVMLFAGRLSEVETWAAQQGLSADGQVAFEREYEYLTLVRLLLYRSRINGSPADATAALGLLGRLFEDADGLRDGSVLEIRLLQALASQALGDTEAATVLFAEALRLAEPEGYWRLVAAEGEPVHGLLRQAVADGVATAYAGDLVRALREHGISTKHAAHEPMALPEALTAREVEILRLIATGMRNQEIADHLVLSVATVKRHIANAYGKLGVTHRTEAVARANELRLI